MLAQLALDEALGQPGGIDRRAGDLGQDVRQGAGVVLVTVGQDDAAHPVAVLREVGGVGDDEIDAEHLRLGEREAAVHDEDVVVDLDDGDVLADLAHPAERDDAQGIGHGSS